MQGRLFKSIITDLLSILYAAHSARCSVLHPHRIPLRARRSVALPWVRASLLGSRPCWRALLRLGVGVGSSIWLATHLPHLVHWAWRLEDTRERICFNELKQWMDGLSLKLHGKGLEVIVTGFEVDGYGVSITFIRLCSHTPKQSYNKLYNDAMHYCSESSDVTSKTWVILDPFCSGFSWKSITQQRTQTMTPQLQCVAHASSHKPVSIIKQIWNKKQEGGGKKNSVVDLLSY